MKFHIKGKLSEFLHGCDEKFTEDSEISYEDLKRQWIKHRDNQTKFSCIFELLQGSDIEWANFYPQKKVKTPEEMKAYKARLQQLEYQQLTKGMDKKTDEYFKGSHKREVSAVINCFITVAGMFIAFYALTSSIGCQPVTCICSGLTAALGIAAIELYYLLRTL